MKSLLIAFAVGLLVTRAAAIQETILSTSPDGALEFVAITHQKPNHVEHALRDTKTKKLVTAIENTEEDFLNPGFSSPQLDWSPDGRMLIISAKLYRHLGEFSAVFRITDDLRLAQITLPKDTAPARWNRDGTLVLRVQREETYSFDPQKQAFIERSK